MWILSRLVFAACVMLARALWPRARASETQGGYDGRQSWQLSLDRRTTSFGVPFQNRMFLRLTRESWFDKIAKFFRLAREFQTGDATFDRDTYISCDHPEALDALESSPDARRAVAFLLKEEEVSRIETDGEHLWARLRDISRPSDEAISALRTLRDALAASATPEATSSRGRFFWRALFVESLALGIAFYGVPGLVEWKVRLAPLYLDFTPVITSGLAVAAALFVGLFFFSNSLLGRSSRGHRVLLEISLLLALGLPWTGIQLVSDFNTSRDLGPATTHRFTVQEKGDRRSFLLRRQRIYWLDLTPDKSTPQKAESLPLNRLRVHASDYYRLHKGDPVEIDLRPGHLGFAWISDTRLSQRQP